MKKNIERSWLTGSGVEISTIELREICTSWDAHSWESYLRWYQSGRREALVALSTYQEICEENFESIFESLAKSETPAKRNLIKRMLSQLPEREAEILRATYLEGRTQVEIAAEFRLSQPRVCQLKNNGLRSLKRGLAGDKFIARRFMRGANDYRPVTETSIWDETNAVPPKEARKYDPDNFEIEIQNFKNHGVREAVLSLPMIAQKIVYLRFWCELSDQQIAKRLQMGGNVISQICDASVSKIKRSVVQFQTGLEL